MSATPKKPTLMKSVSQYRAWTGSTTRSALRRLYLKGKAFKSAVLTSAELDADAKILTDCLKDVASDYDPT